MSHFPCTNIIIQLYPKKFSVSRNWWRLGHQYPQMKKAEGMVGIFEPSNTNKYVTSTLNKGQPLNKGKG